ncbi:hypothetical protein L596_024704 [Steinernema carpocapsae]|uniref:MARVEL domain-containing protein n=1 Tax=Steinernema carpocapsae TaxID=34508 RepID=A0A4U5M5J5_STECR|nr:hypothetical protein L596_024704 [Steinernema carpocapsae]
MMKPDYPTMLHSKSQQLYNPNHQCCCGCMNVRVGTVIVAFLFTLGGICETISNINAALNGSFLAIILMILSLAIVVCGIMAINGANSNKPQQLVPMMVGLIIKSLVLGLMAFGTLILQFDPQSVFPNQHDMSEGMARLAIFAATCILWLMVILCLWYLSTVYNCYKMLMSYDPPLREPTEKGPYVV